MYIVLIADIYAELLICPIWNLLFTFVAVVIQVSFKSVLFLIPRSHYWVIVFPVCLTTAMMSLQELGFGSANNPLIDCFFILITFHPLTPRVLHVSQTCRRAWSSALMRFTSFVFLYFQSYIERGLFAFTYGQDDSIIDFVHLNNLV